MAGVVKRIVVADNDGAALDLACTDLQFEGHEIVARCLDGDTALAAIAEHRPDVAVIDHRMPPGPSGLEVVRRLREAGDRTPVIIYSNYQDPAVVDGVRRAGGRFLPKGDLRRLRDAVLDEAD